MSCRLQNQCQFSENNLFKKVTFPESSAIRMSCLSFLISARVSGQINFVQNARGQKKSPSQAKDEAGNGQRRGRRFEQLQKGRHRLRQTTRCLMQRDGVPNLIISTSPPGRSGGTSLVCHINILQPLQTAAIANQYL